MFSKCESGVSFQLAKLVKRAVCSGAWLGLRLNFSEWLCRSRPAHGVCLLRNGRSLLRRTLDHLRQCLQKTGAVRAIDRAVIKREAELYRPSDGELPVLDNRFLNKASDPKNG